MIGENETIIKEIVILGFPQLHDFKLPFFLMFLILYVLTMTGNIMIVTLVTFSPNLNHPMFFFLGQLSMTDIVITSIVPNMLSVLLKGQVTITLSACEAQLQFFGFSACTECLLLAVMSYDRYLAICRPLHYTSIMSVKLQLQLAGFCWFWGFAVSFITVILATQLDFCGPNIIDHFFCDMLPVLRLSCSDISMIQFEITLLGTPITVFPLLLIFITYVCICIAILNIPSTSGRQKTISTCSSHLTVVIIFYGTLVTLYVVPSHGQLLNANKVISLVYTVVTPLCNPIIYSIRNKEIRIAFNKYVYFTNKSKKINTQDSLMTRG
ncbi:olfactory receptor 6B2-like [Spea bombifrons]|uniref:olfactory receptor 6B2-like n=1 Tax=Spea bombifrons TaxID=233779 RepID=UPI00234BDEC3|nr:olfactory receptor 6B2-like [Spea bombifrons]